MSEINRIVLIVMDSLGVGALPDAREYGDSDTNTLGHIAARVNGLNAPNFQKLGMGNIIDVKGVEPNHNSEGIFGKAAEASKNKDTTSGHWEIAGLKIENSFPTYPNGFPEEIIKPFEDQTGRKVIGNKPASGTDILIELGEEHCKTGDLIVYTSADSVFQIAAHEEVVPLEELYKICEIARNILVGEHAVGRVIARPFLGKSANDFARTSNRHDFSILPPAPTMLDLISQKGFEVAAVGKIEDIFAKQGVTKAVHTISNMDGVDKTIDYIKQDFKGLIFTNLVDFDMLWGHRRNPEAYGKGIEDLDNRLPEIFEALKDDDLVIFTADHGCDPTYEKHTDHTREYIPIIAYGKKLKANVDLGVRKTFADIAATICDFLGVDGIKNGQSFKTEISF